MGTTLSYQRMLSRKVVEFGWELWKWHLHFAYIVSFFCHYIYFSVIIYTYLDYYIVFVYIILSFFDIKIIMVWQTVSLLRYIKVYAIAFNDSDNSFDDVLTSLLETLIMLWSSLTCMADSARKTRMKTRIIFETQKQHDV